MPLSPGDRLGSYEILALLGAGGMGQVYRGRDTKLNREVAIKVLPAALANDAQYMARFEREAQTLAALNHPNIATLYGIEQGALVMELVEGADLRGPLPVEEVIPIARQIAEGLESAHERGIVHRDLKPANIKLTPAGIVKILDFGLAKSATEFSAAPAGASPTISPTLSIALTGAGAILGTAAYMSPEQARGKPVDKRTDIWAFGVVLYELLTGMRLFGGDTVTDTIAAVMTREPDWNALPANTPPHVRRLIERCLRRDPMRRLRDIGEARVLLYTSNESGITEVFVASFPSFAVKRKVSSAGGGAPIWANGGKELFYRSNEGWMMNAEIHTGGQIEVSASKPLFKFGGGSSLANGFAVSADATRFLTSETVSSDSEKPAITLVLNWAADMKQP